MRHIPIRLGPLALLLTVISICMTSLGILAFMTARADLGLAEKYAATVRERYELEGEGQAFLRDVAEACAKGNAPGSLPGTEADGDGVVWKVITREYAGLRIGLAAGGSDTAGYEIVAWKTEKKWEPEPGMGNLWDGE